MNINVPKEFLDKYSSETEEDRMAFWQRILWMSEEERKEFPFVFELINTPSDDS